MTKNEWFGEWAVSVGMVLAFLLLASLTGWTYAETGLYVAVVLFALLILLLAWAVVVVGIIDKYRDRTEQNDKPPEE
jgi:membrane protein implicated in regulation of membrane protease activity